MIPTPPSVDLRRQLGYAEVRIRSVWAGFEAFAFRSPGFEISSQGC